MRIRGGVVDVPRVRINPDFGSYPPILWADRVHVRPEQRVADDGCDEEKSGCEGTGHEDAVGVFFV